MDSKLPAVVVDEEWGYLVCKEDSLNKGRYLGPRLPLQEVDARVRPLSSFTSFKLMDKLVQDKAQLLVELDRD